MVEGRNLPSFSPGYPESLLSLSRCSFPPQATLISSPPNCNVGRILDIWVLPGFSLPVGGRGLIVSGLQDFGDPAVVLFEAMDFEGHSVEVSEALADVELAGYGPHTQAIHVLSGV